MGIMRRRMADSAVTPSPRQVSLSIASRLLPRTPPSFLNIIVPVAANHECLRRKSFKSSSMSEIFHAQSEIATRTYSPVM
ncbi:hypothetical protein KIN20_022100 [Parelaphostrongylus tenuis]|uniref:Uncharacterized protein n=1 Tax=Parelaphostrongylus tenuis TaxID=148309 RepID=A0AAD5QV52_PARTN|nr:hypothetical protein KIN20_022100 [Parelaphostrongylus tenuis]